MQALQKLDLEIIEEWRPYYVKDRQLGGFTQAYAGKLRFMTIRGAGHMAVADEREISFNMLVSMLEGQKM